MLNFRLILKNFSSGSVIVDYRVSWDENSESSLTPDTLLNTVTEYLSSNNGFPNKSYQIPKDTIKMAKLVDACSMKSKRYYGHFQ